MSAGLGHREVAFALTGCQEDAMFPPREKLWEEGQRS